MSPRAASSSSTRIGTSRSPALNLARLASTSPSVATRIVSDSVSVETPRSAATWRLRRDLQFRPVELGGRDRVLDRRDRAHLAGELVGGLVDRVDVGAGDDQRQVALAVVLDEPVADVGRRRRASRRCAPAAPSGVAARFDLLTKLMTKVALRGSARRPENLRRRRPAPSAPPASPSAGRRCARVTRSVSASREPGGSSIASSARPWSSAGRKPDGSSRSRQIEAAKIIAPTTSVIQRQRTEPRTSRV